MLDLSEMDKLVDELADLREEKEKIAKEVSRVSALLDIQEEKIRLSLEAADLDKFAGKRGTASRTQRFSVKFPKHDEGKKEAFREYLESKGDFSGRWEMGWQALNAYYKEEMAAAIQRGDTDFEVPGLESTVDVGIRYQKA